jgi:hypothetical protein
LNRLRVDTGLFPERYFAATLDYICAVQHDDGAIPWFEDAHIDPWNHVEAAMGLSIGGRLLEAERAYRWLAYQQRADGAWLAAYHRQRCNTATHIESNYVAYIATGVWHHYLITGDRRFLLAMWPVVRGAMQFVCALQSPHGDIAWAQDANGVCDDALVTGCSSIYKSLECAVRIARELGGREGDAADWRDARARLGAALRARPHRFDRTWASKERYSMDWFYPVLTGVLRGSAARSRLAARWHEFVRADLGCLCVADRPWVTIAESAELTLALVAAGERQRAATLFNWLHRFRNEDGSWWTGYVYDEPELWPLERPTWTAGATLLAADALSGHTPAHRLFSDAHY